MSVDVGPLGWPAGSLDTILKGDYLRTILPKFGFNCPSSFRQEDFLVPNFLFLATGAILVGGRGPRTQF